MNAKIEFLLEAERYTDALRLISAAVASEPENPLLWDYMTQARLGNEQWAAALDSVGHLLALDPAESLGHYYASFALTELYRFSDGLEAALAAVRLSPDFPAFHLRVAQCAVALGQRQLAWDAASRAVELAPHDDEIHAGFGAVAGELGQRRIAEKALLHALELNPANHLAQHNLGVLQARRGKIGGAARELRSSAAADPTSGLAAQALAGLVKLSVNRAFWWVWATLMVFQLLDYSGIDVVPTVWVLLSLVVLCGWIGWSFRGIDARLWMLLWQSLRRSVSTCLRLLSIVLGMTFVVLAALSDESLRQGLIGLSIFSLLAGGIVVIFGVLFDD